MSPALVLNVEISSGNRDLDALVGFMVRLADCI